MTKVRKMLGIVMAALLCFALTPMSAFAATGINNDDGIITIDNAIKGQTYDAYQLLQLKSYDTETDAYYYTVVDAWKGFFDSTDAKPYVTVSDRGTVTWANIDKDDNGAAIGAFAKLALKYAEDNEIAPTKSTTAVVDEKSGEVVAKITGLNLGYYLVDSSTGAICSIGTTNPSATITEKNGVPTNTKEVQENSQEKNSGQNFGWGKVNDAQIGKVVNFRSTIVGQPGTSAYVYHDTMSAGLTFNNDVVVTYNGETVDPINYTVTASGLTDGCTFEVAFKAEGALASFAKDEEVVITYSAVLNENAVVGAAEPNKSHLDYNNGDRVISTPESKTETFTWGIPVFKYTGSNEALAGAEFKLSTDVEGNNLIPLTLSGTTYITDEQGTYNVAGEDGNISNPIVSGDSGRFDIKGLDSGIYYLTETKAPEGYNGLAAPIKIEIVKNVAVNKETEEITVSASIFVDGAEKAAVTIGSSSYNGEVKVLNETGLQLPSTGGIGTMILYVIGGLLVLGAIVVLVRRRSSAK